MNCPWKVPLSFHCLHGHSVVVTLNTGGLVGGSSLYGLNPILHGISSICNTELGVHPSLFQIQKQYNNIKMAFYTSVVILRKEGVDGRLRRSSRVPNLSLDVRAGWRFAQQNHRCCLKTLGAQSLLPPQQETG